MLLPLLAILALPHAASAASAEEGGLPARSAMVILQLAVILFAAKAGGEVVERLFRQPAVLGEVLGGVVIGRRGSGSQPDPCAIVSESRSNRRTSSSSPSSSPSWACWWI